MALEMKQTLKMSQQLVMTPQLQQAIKLLQLNHLELAEHISQEMVNNPTLEEQQDNSPRDDDLAQVDMRVTPEREADPEASDPRGADPIDWARYLEDDYRPGQRQGVGPTIADDLPPPETNLTRHTSLADHLIWQLHLTTTDQDLAMAAAMIIGEVDDDGYLQAELAEIAASNGVTLELMEAALSLVQSFDPLGVGARDLRECLLIQARTLFADDKVMEAVIDRHLPELERKNYAAIAKDLSVSIPRVIEAVKVITEMEPKPGRPFAGEAPQYITPDVYIQKVGEEYVILLNEDGLPKLRVSPYYRSILSGVVKGDKEYIQEKLRSATWLIKSIHQRQRTVYKVVESIIRHQREFFDKGIAYLKPMILRDIADDIGMHESTISRVTTNKYVHTPQGIYELKYFFNSGISRVHGEDVASETVKQKIKKLIAGENPRRPHSDQEIVELLGERENIDIARRTVAKYREMMGILPSSKRKRVF
ncbi:RNA polymerase factor sigma-54 [Myxococcota bacterium]|nr:RNA polymerase factor sigma-54 [Myxococcota bacterium]